MTADGRSGEHVPSKVLGRDVGQTLPRRFYAETSVAAAEGGFALRLDGRGARTPARNPLVLPTQALAEAVAAEWASVAKVIDPRTMPLTRLANSVIDGVSRTEAAVLSEVLRFGETDLLSYRAEAPADLVSAQAEHWDPILVWCRETLGASLTTTSGVMFVAQPPSSLVRLATGVGELVGVGIGAPFRLGAVHVMTFLTGSLLLACAVAAGRLSDEEAWKAANVDEDHQIALWGRDEEAEQRRRARWIDMKAAASTVSLSRT